MASYPSWYQILVVSWLLLSAALVAGFLLLRPELTAAQGSSTSTIAQVPIPVANFNASAQLRLLAEVDDDVPLKRMPIGVRGYVYSLSDTSKVSRERADWKLEVNRRDDGSLWVIGYVSSETKSKFDRWKSDLSIQDLQVLMFTTSWEEAKETISIPVAFVSGTETFDFRKLSRRHEIQLSRKPKSATGRK